MGMTRLIEAANKAGVRPDEEDDLSNVDPGDIDKSSLK